MSDSKVILITGGSSGIGRAAAMGFAEAGYRVAICGRRMGALQDVSSASGAQAFACDVTDPDDVTRLLGSVESAFGRIDVLFNNAGQAAPAVNFGDQDVSKWRSMIDTNLNGAFYVAREAFRLMRAQSPQGGRIINNGSISATMPRPGAAPYSASKSAISGLTRSISLDGRQFGIACGQIDIGNTATEMTGEMSGGVLQADGSIAPEPTFSVAHVVDALLYMAGLPLEANVQFMTVMATKMPYIGRG
ncbi:SDR family NAD(P)-dependent oxidoreductase [Devosia rhodophyticola]|uniref:SDR family NAD(P)-dependent oxidoreductase n=1 Tax=Devosia rhodophyticola TaxID=3026423 RepID=A0ABY7YXR9_9HYPH|nr:SDR family oxidoreductase [Devosia rhodophyticola]WDR06116.1 SDR family NAD(P)-dependent oxidoreductase [Devosia rhodophyticola]